MRLLVSTLEPSGNLHLKALLNHTPDSVQIFGIFDIDDRGVKIFSSRDFGVMGITSVIPKLLKGKRAIDEMVRLSESADKVLLIDAPAFNIPLSKAIKRRFPKKEIIYYILPKVWAWKEKRKEAIEKYVDKQISIFPFEKDIYRNSLYFGNPILNEIESLKEKPSDSGATAFLPGSRKSEIKALMPIFRKLSKKIDGEKLLSVPHHIEDLSIYGDIEDFRVIRSSEEALFKADFAYICSGTATLESAVIGTPFALLYRTGELEYFIGKRFVKLNYVGLANIIFERAGKGQFHSEHLQHISIDRLLQERDEVDSEKFLEKSREIREMLRGDIRDVVKEITG
jgi:lipid-A-disaccharide synthase